jgi:serine/threonine protein kinase
VALPTGTRLGSYEVIAQIGAGGMGEVYRATDTKLKRPVAIKILPSALAADRDRLARFQREAEVLASLNHPNIAAIYGLEESDGVSALVMELVDGEDLSHRIARGTIPQDEALPIVRQIADALEAAHERGIIHHDLKPANVKLRPDGVVKVLDFGLAKTTEPAAASSPSLGPSPTITTQAMTQAGMILGTAAYMSPEQARGRVVDKRTDIWAFGCIVYEMLTSRRAFPGETAFDTMAAILEREPDWSALPHTVSPSEERLLVYTLQRDPKRRLRDIGDAASLTKTGERLMSTEENKALVRREYELGVNTKNFSVRDEVLAGNFIAHFPGHAPLHGIDAFRQFTSAFFTAFPDLTTTIEDLIAEGDKVAVRQTWRGTHTSEFLHIPPTGKQVTFTSNEVSGGKLAEEWVELDMLGLLQQLGAIPPSGG